MCDKAFGKGPLGQSLYLLTYCLLARLSSIIRPLSASPNSNVSPIPDQLCLHCGLCCNGVIFADVRLQPGDDPDRLRQLGLPLTRSRNRFQFTQPCSALAGCVCSVYPERPAYCRHFECALFKKVKAGTVTTARALRLIRKARARVEKMKCLLRDLGDLDENLALTIRYRRISNRLAASRLDRRNSLLYARLTQMYHQLNLLLARSFYPGDP